MNGETYSFEGKDMPGDKFPSLNLTIPSELGLRFGISNLPEFSSTNGVLLIIVNGHMKMYQFNVSEKLKALELW